MILSVGFVNLSSHLLREFGKGFSERNLGNMRKFYLTYKEIYKKIQQKPSAKSQKELKQKLQDWIAQQVDK